MIIKVKKLWQGKYADIRDYQVKKAIRKKEPIIVVFQGKKMTLTPEALKEKKLLFNKKPITSKINPGQKYFLYSFLFVPDKEETEEESLKRLSQLCL